MSEAHSHTTMERPDEKLISRFALWQVRDRTIRNYLEKGFSLGICCRNCPRTIEWTPPELLRRFGDRLIKRRRSMLDGICAEVVDLLKDRNFSVQTMEVLRKMKPMRQIEAVELMIALNNFSCAYAKALLAATRQADLVQSDKPKKVGKMTPEQMARLEREMATLNQDFRALEASYGDDVLQLVISAAYVGRLIANPAVQAYMDKRQPELLEELRGIVTAASLDQGSSAASASIDDENSRIGWPAEPNRPPLLNGMVNPPPEGMGGAAGV